MSQQHNNTYTVGFVAVMSIVCALILSVTSSALKKRIDQNVLEATQLDVMSSAFALKADQGKSEEEFVKKDELLAQFANTKIVILDYQGKDLTDKVRNGASDEVFAKDVFKINPRKQEKELKAGKIEEKDLELPLFVLNKEDGSVDSYTLPIWGKGLWGDINGYLSLEADKKTVRGITFLSDHKETPGLGAEMTKFGWRSQFIGKQIFNNDGKLKPVGVVKGRVADVKPNSQEFYVDGLAGSTLTCNGITAMLDNCLEIYKPFLEAKPASEKKED